MHTKCSLCTQKRMLFPISVAFHVLLLYPPKCALPIRSRVPTHFGILFSNCHAERSCFSPSHIFAPHQTLSTNYTRKLKWSIYCEILLQEHWKGRKVGMKGGGGRNIRSCPKEQSMVHPTNQHQNMEYLCSKLSRHVHAYFNDDNKKLCGNDNDNQEQNRVSS